MSTDQVFLLAGGALLVLLVALGGIAWLTRNIVDPFKGPLGDRARVRDAGPAWTAALAEWEGRYREWLLIPGAREVFTESLLIEDAQGAAHTYAQLLDLAGRRAAWALQERQRQQRAAPAGVDPRSVVRQPVKPPRGRRSQQAGRAPLTKSKQVRER